MRCLLLVLSILALLSCSKKSDQPEVWIYTSLYKDTIAEMTPKLEKAFPGVKINWYQAGSEEIAAKVNTELMAGEPKVDVLLSSERFWYQELSDNGKLHKFKPTNFALLYDDLKNLEETFQIASIPVMVLVYNNEIMKAADAPKTFKALGDTYLKDKVTGGSPLASGTNFTTVAALQNKYGWGYFKQLKQNNFFFEGGNSAVLRRIQNKEKAVGWVLLENVLRFKNEDPRLQVIYPEDGVVTQFNTLAITKKASSREIAEKVANWMLSPEGQEMMTNSYMYSVLKGFKAPVGAPEFMSIKAKALQWNESLIKDITKNRDQIKEEFSKIVFK